MIQGLQTAIKESWILKGFLGVLMLSFAVWGVGDAIAPSIDPNIAIKVEQMEVQAEELQRRFTQQYENLRDALGPDFTTKDAVELGVMETLIQELTRTAALQMAAQDMDLAVADETLRRVAMEQDAFKDQTGNFSRMQLNAILASNNLTEQGFIDLLRSDITEQTMLQPIAASAAAPETMVNALFLYRAEQRVAELLYLDDASVTLSQEPSDTDLRSIYDENIESFTEDESRGVELIVIRPRDLVPESSITEEEIQAFYDENLDRYSTQPTRTVRQLIFPSEAEAQEAYAQLEDGDTLIDLGARIAAGEPIDLGTLSPNDTTGFDIGPIFEVSEKSITSPVESIFGWHLFEIIDLTIGSISALPVVRDEILDFIIQDRAFDEIFDATIFLEDQLAAGVPMAEVGETPGYNYINFEAVNRDGRDRNGSRLTFPVEEQRLLNQIFSTQEGLETPLVETDDYAYVARVTEVVAPAPKPYDSVQSEVAAMWEQQARASQTKAKGEDLLSAIGPSTKLLDIANDEEDVQFANLGPVTRFGDSLRLDYIIPARLVSPAFMDALFAAQVGEVVSARVSNGHVVARLTEIVDPDDPELEDLRAQIKTSVGNSLGNDLVASFTQEVTAPYSVIVNRETIDQLTPQ